MPNLQIWCGLLFLVASPVALANQKQPPAPTAVKAPEQPSAALLEFIGDWNEDERQLIGMETQLKNTNQKQDTKEVPHAP